MCELMGISFNRPITASVSLRAFGLRSEENPDGWGLAWYPDRSLAMVKQPLRWSAQQTEFLEDYPGLLSSIYVAHVRHRTTGPMPTHADTHPFARELGGRDYCFAHNGTLTGAFWHKPLGRFQPIGQTDSEFLFCLLLAELERAVHPAGTALSSQDGHGVPHALETEQQWKWLHQLLLHFNDFGKLNCILTDGERLIIYHDKNKWKNLTYRKVLIHQDSGQHFGDVTVGLKLQAEPVNHGCIVATNPLSAEGWERFLPGEMKVLHQGSVVFAGRPDLQEGPATVKSPGDPVHVATTAT